MDSTTILFYIVSGMIIFCALGVLLNPSPIFSALYLVLTMVGVSAVYFMLDASFVGGVQLMVYAGAVTVLFVMVLMLFDLKKERQAFTRGFLSGILKIFSAGALCMIISVSAYMSIDMLGSPSQPEVITTKSIAAKLFTNYIAAFEILGVVLLMVAIGAVSISRIKGGTHAK